MDIYLLTASKILMLFSFWIGLPAMLLAVLLFHGFRNDSRYTALVGMVGIVGLGSWGLGLSLEGLVTGVSLDLRFIGHTYGVVLLADDPQYYWAATAVWITLSLAAIAVGVWSFVNILRRPNTALKPKARAPRGPRLS